MHGVIDSAPRMFRCRTENVIDRASEHGHPFKLQLGLFSVYAHSPNFWTRLYDILSSITSSKNAHLGWFLGWQAFVVGLKVDMIRKWNISWPDYSVFKIVL